ncbi:MAG TPA: metal-dependent hydrolase [Gemmatimonadaceae bacterium]|nr:metal-dependent hydrolase [Gemmatimonadaceae bacterium]
MPSAVSHAVVALAVGTAFRRPGPPARFWVLAAACAVAPDLDIVGLWAGVPYTSMLGHRGLSHSLFGAAVLATLALLAFRGERWRAERGTFWLCFFVGTALHGVLDAMTYGGGLGVAFFAPFDTHRFFLPWRPILVSPVHLRRFFTVLGITIFRSEARWVWLPSAVFVLAVMLIRAMARSRGGARRGPAR